MSDCGRPAFRDELCFAHLKRRQRGLPLSGPIQEPLDARQKLLEAALKYADSDSEDDREYQRRERALLYSAVQLGRRAAAEPAPGVVQVDAPNEEQALERTYAGRSESKAEGDEGAAGHVAEESREADRAGTCARNGAATAEGVVA
jgi:hypothetical protein